MTDEHETKVENDPGHIQFISPINDDWYEDIISFNNINNHIVHQQENTFCGNPNTSLHMGNHLLYLDLITNDLGIMLWFNGI